MRWLGSITQLNGCELEQTLRESGGQGDLACSLWDCKELDTSSQLNTDSKNFSLVFQVSCWMNGRELK